jgi:mannosyl-oligosaccharide alpha-1,2-mannosidase
VFILYRITGERVYQDTAWRMFENIRRQCRTNTSFAGTSDVNTPGAEKVDTSESFWMAETLKYFYLIFSEPDLISLDEFVL